MVDVLEAIQGIITKSLHVYLAILIPVGIIILLYEIYKKKTGKTIDWLEHGLSEEDEDEDKETVKVINDKITYLGIKNETSSSYKPSVATGIMSSGLYGTAGVLSPVENSKEVIYFKYGETTFRVKDNMELYFLVKEKKYKDTLNCKVKQVSKLGKITSKTIEFIEGVKV